METGSHLKRLLILGSGGTSIDILDFVDDINSHQPTYECIGFLDDNQNKWGKKIYNLTVLGPLEHAHQFTDVYFVNGLGSPANFSKREEIIARIGIPMERFETIIHPDARVSRKSFLGSGSVIYPNSVIGANVQIGEQAIILSNVAINHDTSVGSYTILASGVCVSGGVKIGKCCYLGTGSKIIQDAVIGDYCLIGMGSVVLDNVNSNSVVVGNPARRIKTS